MLNYGKCKIWQVLLMAKVFMASVILANICMANETEPSPSDSVTPKWIRRYRRVKTWF